MADGQDPPDPNPQIIITTPGILNKTHSRCLVTNCSALQDKILDGLQYLSRIFIFIDVASLVGTFGYKVLHNSYLEPLVERFTRLIFHSVEPDLSTKAMDLIRDELNPDQTLITIPPSPPTGPLTLTPRKKTIKVDLSSIISDKDMAGRIEITRDVLKGHPNINMFKSDAGITLEGPLEDISEASKEIKKCIASREPDPAVLSNIIQTTTTSQQPIATTQQPTATNQKLNDIIKDFPQKPTHPSVTPQWDALQPDREPLGTRVLDPAMGPITHPTVTSPSVTPQWGALQEPLGPKVPQPSASLSSHPPVTHPHQIIQKMVSMSGIENVFISNNRDFVEGLVKDFPDTRILFPRSDTENITVMAPMTEITRVPTATPTISFDTSKEIAAMTTYGMTSRHHHDSLTTTEEEEGVNCHIEISTESSIMPAGVPHSRPPRPPTTLSDMQALADSFQTSIELQMGVTTPRLPTSPSPVTPRLPMSAQSSRSPVAVPPNTRLPNPVAVNSRRPNPAIPTSRPPNPAVVPTSRPPATLTPPPSAPTKQSISPLEQELADMSLTSPPPAQSHLTASSESSSLTASPEVRRPRQSSGGDVRPPNGKRAMNRAPPKLEDLPEQLPGLQLPESWFYTTIRAKLLKEPCYLSYLVMAFQQEFMEAAAIPANKILPKVYEHLKHNPDLFTLHSKKSDFFVGLNTAQIKAKYLPPSPEPPGDEDAMTSQIQALFQATIGGGSRGPTPPMQTRPPRPVAEDVNFGDLLESASPEKMEVLLQPPAAAQSDVKDDVNDVTVPQSDVKPVQSDVTPAQSDVAPAPQIDVKKEEVEERMFDAPVDFASMLDSPRDNEVSEEVQDVKKEDVKEEEKEEEEVNFDDLLDDILEDYDNNQGEAQGEDQQVKEDPEEKEAIKEDEEADRSEKEEGEISEEEDGEFSATETEATPVREVAPALPVREVIPDSPVREAIPSSPPSSMKSADHESPTSAEHQSPTSSQEQQITEFSPRGEQSTESSSQPIDLSPVSSTQFSEPSSDDLEPPIKNSGLKTPDLQREVESAAGSETSRSDDTTHSDYCEVLQDQSGISPISSSHSGGSLVEKPSEESLVMPVEEPLEVSLEGTQESSEQQEVEEEEEEEEEEDVYTTLFQSRQRKMVSVGQTDTGYLNINTAQPGMVLVYGTDVPTRTSFLRRSVMAWRSCDLPVLVISPSLEPFTGIDDGVQLYHFKSLTGNFIAIFYSLIGPSYYHAKFST
eukprot:sb/3461194/